MFAVSPGTKVVKLGVELGVRGIWERFGSSVPLGSLMSPLFCLKRAVRQKVTRLATIDAQFLH